MIDVLSDLFIMRGSLGHIGFGKGPGFAAVRVWITGVGAETAFIEPEFWPDRFTGGGRSACRPTTRSSAANLVCTP